MSRFVGAVCDRALFLSCCDKRAVTDRAYNRVHPEFHRIGRFGPACVFLLFSLFLAAPAAAQNYVEARLGHSRNGTYRYVDYNHTFKNRLVADVLYFGAPGQNEAYFGAGYQVRSGASFTLTPLFYGVVGKENREAGLAAGAVFGASIAEQWNVGGFFGTFWPLRGSVPRYTYLDTLDATRKFSSWEAGVSTGFYRIAGSWNPLAGPVVVKNDGAGAWRFSVRGGTAPEIRLTRTVTF